MNKEINKKQKLNRRKARVRSKIIGTAECPRLSVFRSNKGIYLQLVDDSKSITLVSAYITEIKNNKDNKTVNSFELGKLIAKKAIDKKIVKVVFDRGGNKYHGRIKAVADGAREGGLKF